MNSAVDAAEALAGLGDPRAVERLLGAARLGTFSITTYLKYAATESIARLLEATATRIPDELLRELAGFKDETVEAASTSWTVESSWSRNDTSLRRLTELATKELARRGQLRDAAERA